MRDDRQARLPLANLAYHVERGARRTPQRAALRFEGQTWTYGYLNEQANRMANLLRSLGIGAGERVALYLPNCPAFVVAYLGAVKLGAIAVSINPMFKRQEVAFILADCTPRLLLATESGLDNLPDGPWTLLLASEDGVTPATLETRLQAASPDAQAVALPLDSPAALVYTSGTTGFPKGATLSHGNVISNMHAKTRYCGMQPQDRLLLYVPLFHCFGQNAILNSGLNAGSTIVLQRRFDPERVLHTIEAEQVTMFFGVPTVYIRLLQAPLETLNLRSLRYCLSAAAPLPVEVARHWQERLPLVINEGYGLTETSPFAAYSHLPKEEPGAIGMPIERVAMQVVDADGTALPPGEVGEIAIRGPNVMLGYWNRPDETARVLRDGWFHTGDLGRQDEQGFFYLVDRLKDMINVSGFKVYPAEVENVLHQHPALLEAAVYGLPDAVRGEQVCAALVLKAGQQATAEEIQQFCRETMAAYKVPHVLHFVEALPKNATGKVLKATLRNAAHA